MIIAFSIFIDANTYEIGKDNLVLVRLSTRMIKPMATLSLGSGPHVSVCSRFCDQRFACRPLLERLAENEANFIVLPTLHAYRTILSAKIVA